METTPNIDLPTSCSLTWEEAHLGGNSNKKKLETLLQRRFLHQSAFPIKTILAGATCLQHSCFLQFTVGNEGLC